MTNDKLFRLSSITKKLLVALLGGFLLVFLLFHMCANLLILKHDGGVAYSAFCHFMNGSLIKIFEFILLACFLLHICLTTWLWFSNRHNRPIRYHQRSRTRTARASKLMMISGSLLIVCLALHFYDFYLTKTNLVKGLYRVQIEQLIDERADGTMALLRRNMEGRGMNFENFDEEMENELLINFQGAEKEYGRDLLRVMSLYDNVVKQQRISPDMKWINQLTSDERNAIEHVFPMAKAEPDFYHQVRNKFSVWHIALCYLIFFALIGIHIRHGFESVFQSIGLNHYKYTSLIRVLGILYCWIICIGFSAVVLGVYFGL